MDEPVRAISRAAATFGDLAAAPRRTAEYCIRTTVDWARGSGVDHDGPDALPIVRPGPLVALEAATDDWLLAMFQAGRRPRSPNELARIEAEAAEAIALYRQRGWYDEPRSYFVDPPGIDNPFIAAQRRRRAVGFERLSFLSGYQPHADEPGVARWSAHRANRTAYAWLLRHPYPAPWLVCVHGAATGRPILDSAAFRALRLHRGLGLNVAMPIMPLHGSRRDGLPIGVGFPDEDLVDTVHAVAQAVWDIRRVVGFLRMQGDERIGLYGVSLGSYVAALVASVEEDLTCVIAGVPIVDFAELFARHSPARFRARGDYDALPRLAREVHRVISPLALAPLVPRPHRYIYAGLADRLADPRLHARALWRHWDRPSIRWYPGGHVGFRQSPAVRDFVEDALVASGMVSDRAPRPTTRPATSD